MNKLEFRLYYDDEGKVLCYTSENLPGKYLVITPEQFAEARPDVYIMDGQIIKTHKPSHHFKLSKNDSEGTATSKYDINILTSENCNFWKLEPYAIN